MEIDDMSTETIEKYLGKRKEETPFKTGDRVSDVRYGKGIVLQLKDLERENGRGFLVIFDKAGVPLHNAENLTLGEKCWYYCDDTEQLIRVD